MKKYVLRQIGWIFDDALYNYDSEYHIEGVYDHKKEAFQKKLSIDYNYFLQYYNVLDRFQFNRKHLGDEPYEYVDIQQLVSYTAKRQGIDLERLMEKNKDSRYLLTETSKELHRLSREEVQRLLNTIGVSFTKLLEFESSDIVFNVPKRNPVWWEKYFEEGHQHHYFESYYFIDDYDEHRAYQHIIECYQSALDDSYESIAPIITDPSFLTGKLDVLSETPDLLNNLIAISEHVSYDDEQEAVLFNDQVTAEELMGIDAVLREPILLIERKPIAQMKFMDMDTD